MRKRLRKKFYKRRDAEMDMFEDWLKSLEFWSSLITDISLALDVPPEILRLNFNHNYH